MAIDCGVGMNAINVDHDWHIRMANIYLHEARRFRQTTFHATLLLWARGRRLKAASASVQQELFA